MFDGGNAMKVFPIGLALFACGIMIADAQTAGQQTQNRQQTTRENRNNDGRIEAADALKKLAEDHSVKIFFDETVRGRINPVQSKDLETALDEVTRQVTGLIWRKVYTQKLLGSEPKPETVLNAVRSMLNIELTGLMIYDSRINRVNSFVRDFPVGLEFEQSLTQMNPPYEQKPYYVVLNPNQSLASKGDPQARYLAMQQEMMNMMATMSPEDRQRMMESSMQMWFNMDPETRNQMMFTGMRLSMQQWRNMSPDQQQQMMDMGRKWFEEFMGGERR